jgi:hypothetical protein
MKAERAQRQTAAVGRNRRKRPKGDVPVAAKAIKPKTGDQPPAGNPA